MSTKGVYTALSGAMAQNARLDTIANNIANANTTAFKKDTQVFNEFLSAYERPQDVIAVPRIPASIESFYDMQGGDRSYVNAAGTSTKHQQGTLKATGSTLDLAIEGNGFFEVLTPQGVKLTRNGGFRINGTGQLVNKEGFQVLKAGSQDPEQRGITVSSPNLTFSANGDIYDGGVAVGKISLVDVDNKDALQKTGSSFYQVKPNYNVAIRPAIDGTVHQGFLESSNVNIIEEMTDMITASRTFETNQQAMKAFDRMDEKLVTEVPKT